MAFFARLSSTQIDKINILLILASAIAAVFIPFELFLFSYAVLGPLHYLTEISWLHQKEYFLPDSVRQRRRLFPVFVIIFAVTVAIGLARLNSNEGTGISVSGITFYVFCVSLILIFFKRNSVRLSAVILLTFLSIFMHLETEIVTCTGLRTGATIHFDIQERGESLHQLLQENCQDINNDQNYKQNVDFMLRYSNHFWVMLFGTYFPTLIHVYVFTLLFMLYGALKSGSLYGRIAVGVLLLAAVFLLFVPLSISYNISSYALDTYQGLFANVNKSFIKDFHYGDLAKDIYSSKAGLMLARFIAFAYTYHYLNWFSKTSIIQWHKMPRLNLAIVLVLWFSAIALYIVSFKLGFIALLFLSFMHVFLEFPLNIHSIKGIYAHFFESKKQVPAKAKK